MSRAPRRLFLAPEVIQTSAMDCGPASLKGLLEGAAIGQPPIDVGSAPRAFHRASQERFRLRAEMELHLDGP